MQPKTRSNWITLYVLELEHGCFYVGQSASPEVRISTHQNGKGSAWTKLHPPIKLIERRPTESKDFKHAEEIENQFTLMMMRKYGWQRVRGGFWTNTSEELTQKNLIHHERTEELAVSKPIAAYKTNMEKPLVLASSELKIRAKQRWTAAEDKLLLSEYETDRGVNWIANQHFRTKEAIIARLVLLGIDQNKVTFKRLKNTFSIAPKAINTQATA